MINLSIPKRKVKYIFITHTHIDHIRGLVVLKNHLDASVIATPQVINQLENLSSKDIRYKEIASKAIPVGLSRTILLNDFNITSIPTFHDSPGSTGYKIKDVKNSFTFSIVTDTGNVDEQIINAFNESDAFFLESNYDEELLAKSRRPIWLKQRIKKVHLSNKNATEIINSTKLDKTKAILLGHFSGECNSLDKITIGLRENIKESKILNELQWRLCPRDKSSNIVEFECK